MAEVQSSLASNKKGGKFNFNTTAPNYADKVEKLRQKKLSKTKPIKHTKVHVTNLPAKLFSPVGKISKAFLITDKGSSECNGNAFVIFQDEASAKKATHLNSLKFGGQPIHVAFAKPKKDVKSAKESENAEVTTEGASKKRVFEESTTTSDKSDKSDKSEKSEKSEKSDKSDKSGPIKKRPKLDEKRADRIVEVTGLNFKIDEKAVYRDFRQFKLGNPVQVDKKNENTVQILFISPENAVAAAEKIDGFKYKKHVLSAKLLVPPKLQNCRLIVRNLSYKATKEELEKTFGEYGKVTEVSIPVNPANAKPAGYGFVQFTNRSDAEKAIAGLQATDVRGRKVVVDFAVAASEYLKAKVTAAVKQSGAVESEGGESGEDNEDNEDGEDEEGDDEEGELEDMDEDEEMDDEEGDEDDGDEGAGEGDEGEEDEGEDLEAGEGEDEDEMDFDEDEFNKYDEDMGLFIRNLSYETTKEDLEKFFSKYGPLKYALIVKNKETNASRGCAFVHFKNREDGIKVLKRYQDLNPPSSLIAMHTKGKKEKTFVPSTSLDNTFLIGGRHISLHTAVDRDDIREDRRETKKLVKKDSRNLDLARFAQIKPKDTTGYTPDEKRIWSQVISERNRQLKNPNVHVSPLRIVINNLPFKVTEEDIKKHFMEEGTLPGQKPAIIKQVKVMRDKGSKRSRGFGFVEFLDPLQAKQAIKKTNGQSFAGNRIFTSFTCDDARLRQQAEKLAEKRREEAKERLKSNPDFKSKQKERAFKRKMKKLEKELQEGKK